MLKVRRRAVVRACNTGTLQHTRVVVQDPRDTVNSTSGLVHSVHHRRLTPQVELRCRLYGAHWNPHLRRFQTHAWVWMNASIDTTPIIRIHMDMMPVRNYVHSANSHSSACDFSLPMGIAQGATADRGVRTWSFARRSLAGLLGTLLLTREGLVPVLYRHQGNVPLPHQGRS